MSVCGGVTALTCTFGCDLCEDDGQDFICLCYQTCPDVQQSGVPVTCTAGTRSQCVGEAYGHPDITTQPFACLSAYSEVKVLGKGYTYLKDVEQGDKVLVSSSDSSSTDASLDDEQYQEIYGFGHRDVYALATFLQFTTTGNQETMPLELTGEHLVMKQQQTLPTGNGSGSVVPVRADSIKVGDFLVGSQGVGEMVTQISSIRRPGLYTPLTKDGNMVVNGVQVSSYTAVQDRHPESFVVGDNTETISHYLMNHAAVSPFRIMCLAGGLTHFCEQHNAEGQLLFVKQGETLVSWISKQAAEVQIVMLPPAFMVMMYFYLMEQIFGGFIVMHVFPLCCFLVFGFLCISFVHRKCVGKKASCPM